MTKRDYDHFLWTGSYWLTSRSTDPLGEDSLLFTTRFLRFSGIHLIDLWLTSERWSWSQSWNHLVAFNRKILNWESSTLTTRLSPKMDDQINNPISIRFSNSSYFFPSVPSFSLWSTFFCYYISQMSQIYTYLMTVVIFTYF